MARDPTVKRGGDALLDASSAVSPVAFGDYEVLGKIGRGGMANVYYGRHRADLERRLAIKCMRPKLASEERFVEMFSREAKLALLLDHPSIVRTVDGGQAEGRFFIAMEYIPGQDLNAILRRCSETSRRLPVPHALHCIAATARALQYAHTLRGSRGRPLNIVNRDVSPANVRISYDGEVKLLDFGIAQAVLQVSSEIGVLKGKFAYMSPEQIRGLPVDARSDIFSLGVVAHEVLTGERLFREESEFALMEKVRNAQIRPPSAYDKRVPERVDGLVMRMLDRDPARRVATALEVVEAIEPLIAGYQFEKSELGSFVRTLFPADYRQEQDRAQVVAAAPVADDQSVPSAGAPQPKRRRRRRRDPSNAAIPAVRRSGSTVTLLFVAGLLTLAAVIMLIVALV